MRLWQSSIVLVIYCFSWAAYGFTNPSVFEKENSELKALVFLSASCPCSRSHIDHLNKLNASNSNLKVFGVITDDQSPSNLKKLEQYYTKENFKFPILKDPTQSLVKKYDALKTPHVVLLKKQKNGKFQKIYEGGVTDQRQFSRSKNKFLAENLAALKQSKPIPHEKGRSLGCYIRRF